LGNIRSDIIIVQTKSEMTRKIRSNYMLGILIKIKTSQEMLISFIDKQWNSHNFRLKLKPTMSLGLPRNFSSIFSPGIAYKQITYLQMTTSCYSYLKVLLNRKHQNKQHLQGHPKSGDACAMSARVDLAYNASSVSVSNTTIFCSLVLQDIDSPQC